MNTLTHGGPSQLRDLIDAINEFVEIADKAFPDCPVTGFLRDSLRGDRGALDPGEFRRYAARARPCACAARTGAARTGAARTGVARTGAARADEAQHRDAQHRDAQDRAAATSWLGDGVPPGGGAVALTAREMVVLSLMADGLIAAAIARQLGISPRTVGKHVENIYRKFGTQDRASAVLRAHSLGLIRPR